MRRNRGTSSSALPGGHNSNSLSSTGSFENSYLNEEGNFPSSQNLNGLSRSTDVGGSNISINYGAEANLNAYGSAGGHNASSYYSSLYHSQNSAQSHSYTSLHSTSNGAGYLNSSPPSPKVVQTLRKSPTKRSQSFSKGHRLHRSFRCWITLFVLAIASILIIGAYSYLRSRNLSFHHPFSFLLPSSIYSSSSSSHEKRMKEDDIKQRYEEQLEQAKIHIKELEHESRSSQIIIQTIKAELEKIKNKERDNTEQELTVVRKREKALSNQIQQLKDRISTHSYNEVVHRYGNGPYQVMFHVDIPFDPRTDPKASEHDHPFFVVEMHELLHMPHSIHVFLEQVHHGLWDNTYILINAPHILQVSTVQDLTLDRKDVRHRERFEDLDVQNVLFQEYNDDHQHKPMTLGFAGRPGGPDFYINKIDNTMNHGPGGQTHHDLNEEADPCFATVVEGREVLQRIFIRPVKDNAGYELVEPVKIVRAYILHDVDEIKEEGD